MVMTAGRDRLKAKARWRFLRYLGPGLITGAADDLQVMRLTTHSAAARLARRGGQMA